MPFAHVVPPADEDYEPLALGTTRGLVHCRYYPSPDARRGVVWVGGAGGGWDTPARGLYPRLSRSFVDQGIASLRIRFRNPTDLAEAVHDALAGVRFLEERGIGTIGLTGHSLGGAVAIQAAARSTLVRAVVALATQSHGADVADRLGPRCAILLIHGTEDEILPWTCSAWVHERAGEPKRLRLIDGARHVLDEAAEVVEQEVRAWLPERLAEAAMQAGRGLRREAGTPTSPTGQERSSQA